MKKTVTPILEVICPTTECGNNITREFNRLYIATFSITQEKFTHLKNRIEGKHSFTIDKRIKNNLINHEKGNNNEVFDLKCSNCKRRVVFKINTLTGMVSDKNGKSLNDPITPIEPPQALMYSTCKIGPEPQLTYPVVYLPDHEFIMRHPGGYMRQN